MTSVAVVGTGFGARVHVPALRAAGFEVVALVGTDGARTRRRAARADVPHACTDLDDALALADAVTIASPPTTHAPLALAALASGRPVLCEKPFASNVAEAATMLAAAQQAGVAHVVGHEFRFAPDRALLGRVLAAGAIGAPRLVTLVQHVPLAADPATAAPGWWFDPTAGGGWLGASGSHAVDQVRTWLGEFESVSASLGGVADRPRGAAEDTFTVRFRLAGGVDGVLQQTAAAWGAVGGVTCVAGSAGTLWIDGAGVRLADRGGTRTLPVPPELTLPEPPPPAPGAHRFTHLELGPYTRLAEGFRARIEGTEPESPVAVPTFEDGVAATRVLDAVRASAARGGALVAVR